jgi:hypothetical protein
MKTQADLYLIANPDIATGDTVKDATCQDDYNTGVRTWTFDDKSALVFESGDIEIQRNLRSFTSVGGYPLLYLTDKDTVLCPSCASTNDEPTTPHVNYESRVDCDECSTEIEAAYDIVE